MSQQTSTINFADDLTPEFLTSLKEEGFLKNLEADAMEAEVRTTVRAKPGKQDARSIAKLIALIEQMETLAKDSGTEKWFPDTGPTSIYNLPKHKAFFDAGADYPERLFMASNRSGKSVAGAFELTCHLTGEYPSWWAGKVFDFPINAWAVGKDARATRATAQQEL